MRLVSQDISIQDTAQKTEHRIVKGWVVEATFGQGTNPPKMSWGLGSGVRVAYSLYQMAYSLRDLPIWICVQKTYRPRLCLHEHTIAIDFPVYGSQSMHNLASCSLSTAVQRINTTKQTHTFCWNRNRSDGVLVCKCAPTLYLLGFCQVDFTNMGPKHLKSTATTHFEK